MAANSPFGTRSATPFKAKMRRGAGYSNSNPSARTASSAGDDDVTSVQGNESVGVLHQLVDLVLDHDDGVRVVLRQPPDGGDHFGGSDGIELRRGVVEEIDLGSDGVDRGQRHPLLLPAREVVGDAVLQLLDPEERERRGQPRGDLCAREAAVFQAPGELVPNEQVEELRFGILEHQADALADASQRELLRAPTVDQDVTADL